VSAREDYIRRMNTPTPFSEGPEMQNYNRMMDLQSKASTFGGNDPRIQELKDARRQYNRFDKYRIGQEQGMSPLDVQRQFANQSEGLRTSAPDAYRTMYPIANAIMDYTSAGGLLGLAAKAGGNFLSNISDFGKDMFDKKGITGAADTDEEEMQEYARQTFGFDGTTRPYPQQDFPITYPQDKPIGFTFEQEGGNKYFNDLNEEELAFLRGDTDTIADEAMNVPVPFNDSRREAGIASMYGQGPTFATNNRRYENEYRDFLANMTDTTRSFAPTYEEFADAYERRYKGKPQMDFSRTMVLR
tara:strand:+ start:1782 stop:2684 length:903 start_codon:yes stop_codon:yes gene_type:complete